MIMAAMFCWIFLQVLNRKCGMVIMYTVNKANVLATCNSRALSLFTRRHVPRISLSQSRILLSSIDRKPSNFVTPCVLGTTLLTGEVTGHVPLTQQAYYNTKAKDPLPVQVQLNKKLCHLIQSRINLNCTSLNLQ